jgi:hypothetical protein
MAVSTHTILGGQEALTRLARGRAPGAVCDG